ncbi:unnamed protein product [Menidia menidia]|uniref:(Atlantic silverside) hypothetical protein n=1 Tax=Menidia menidia TaxID=238744 RepID=A0A8S4BZS5_9TELE|nr:unnamed protein product [Menidia menidia]
MNGGTPYTGIRVDGTDSGETCTNKSLTTTPDTEPSGGTIRTSCLIDGGGRTGVFRQEVRIVPPDGCVYRVVVRDLLVQVSPLSVPSMQIPVSGVPPFIPNIQLENKLRRFGKLASGFRSINLGCKDDKLKHVQSLRRQTFLYFTFFLGLSTGTGSLLIGLLTVRLTLSAGAGSLLTQHRLLLLARSTGAGSLITQHLNTFLFLTFFLGLSTGTGSLLIGLLTVRLTLSAGAGSLLTQHRLLLLARSTGTTLYFLVQWTATPESIIAEKEASHKYVDAKGSSCSKAFCPSSGCSCLTHTQNCVSVDAPNFICRPRAIR